VGVSFPQPICSRNLEEERATKLRLAGCSLIVAVCIALLSACASTDPYPESWSPVVADSGGCPDLNGTFYNSYSKSDSDAEAIKGGLIVLLLGKPSAEEAEGAVAVERVSIEHQPGRPMVVRGWHDDELVRQGERRISAAACSKKGLSVPGAFRGTNEENVVGFISTSAHLRRAENGDLVGRIKWTFTGLALLVPVTTSSTSWYSFRQVEADREVANQGA
jgi:hypothetical protein